MGNGFPEGTHISEKNAERASEVDLAFVFRAILSKWKAYVFVSLVGGIAGLAISYAIPPKFTARVTMVPQPSGAQAGILGRLATLTNMNLDAEGANEAVYGEIVRSNSVLDRAIARDWKSKRCPDGTTLFKVFGVEVKGSTDMDQAIAAEALRRVLREDCLGFRRDPVTGFMKIQATVPRDPEIAADLANFVVDELDAFNRTVRAAKATEHRKFVAVSLDEVAARLADAESTLTEFEVENTMYAAAPRLRQSHEMLVREAQAQRGIWLELRTELESAIVDEHKMMTSVGILDRAIVPTKKSSPVRSIWAIAGAGLAIVLGFAAMASRGGGLAKVHNS